MSITIERKEQLKSELQKLSREHGGYGAERCQEIAATALLSVLAMFDGEPLSDATAARPYVASVAEQLLELHGLSVQFLQGEIDAFAD